MEEQKNKKHANVPTQSIDINQMMHTDESTETAAGKVNVTIKDPTSTTTDGPSDIDSQQNPVIQRNEIQKLPVILALRIVVTNPWNWILGVHWFTVLTIQIALYPIWFISYMSLKFGYSRETATLINGLYFALCGIGCVVLGKLSTKYKRRKIFYIISSVGLLSVLYIIYCRPNAHIVVVITCNVIAGFCSGIDSIEFGVVREYNEQFGTSDAAGGLINCFGFLLSGAVIPWLMGILMDHNWMQRDGQLNEDTGDRMYSLSDYNTAFAVIPVVLVLNWCTTLLIKETNGESVQWNAKNTEKSKSGEQ